LHFNEVFWFDQPTSSAKETSQQPSYDSPHVARAYRKHAFSVSGRFRQMLADLIKTKHNSNHKTSQITLEGEIIQEYSYYVLGFVPINVINVKNDVWFCKLSDKQIISLEESFSNRKNAIRAKI